MSNLPTPTSGASIPSHLVKGSFYQLQRTPPSLPEGTTITGGKLFLRDNEGTEQITDGLAGALNTGRGFYTFGILGSHTSELDLGRYTLYTTFQIDVNGDAQNVADYQREFELVAIPQPKNTDQIILDLLLETLERKLSGRGDIIQYTIGDRQLATMGLVELNNAISYYRARTGQYPNLRAVNPRRR